jgi:hypothetical protein
MALTRAQWRQAVQDVSADVATKEAVWVAAREAAEAAIALHHTTVEAAKTDLDAAVEALRALRQARRALFGDSDA